MRVEPGFCYVSAPVKHFYQIAYVTLFTFNSHRHHKTVGRAQVREDGWKPRLDSRVPSSSGVQTFSGALTCEDGVPSEERSTSPEEWQSGTDEGNTRDGGEAESIKYCVRLPCKCQWCTCHHMVGCTYFISPGITHCPSHDMVSSWHTGLHTLSLFSLLSILKLLHQSEKGLARFPLTFIHFGTR